ncbi:MAG: NUDIX hydrolase [Lachnospiraceae bacterium]|nr:NUDIX hydrolase [Lachnospiraceae bacterium]
MGKEPTSEEIKALTWEVVSEEHLLKDRWIDFRITTYRLPDGTVFSPYYSYSRRSYVVIVASDEDGNYLCVRQFRHGIRQVTTEFPAGGIERTDGKDYADGADGGDGAEEALVSAKRELLEETGYVSDDWTHLMTVPSNATISDNYAHIFRAKNCRKSANLHLDETEFLNVIRLTADEIEELIAEEQFQQAVHVMAWLLANRQ